MWVKSILNEIEGLNSGLDTYCCIKKIMRKTPNKQTLLR